MSGEGLKRTRSGMLRQADFYTEKILRPSTSWCPERLLCHHHPEEGTELFALAEPGVQKPKDVCVCVCVCVCACVKCQNQGENFLS